MVAPVIQRSAAVMNPSVFPQTGLAGKVSQKNCDRPHLIAPKWSCRVADCNRCTILDVDGGQEGQPQRLVNTPAPFLYAAHDREGETAKQLKSGGGFGSGHWYEKDGGASHHSGRA